MSQEIHPMAKKKVVYEMPGVDAVSVQRDVEFHATDAGPLTMDVYFPPAMESGERRPVVVIVTGFPGEGFQAHLGCQFKEMASVISWARLIAASGMVAIAYSNREPVAGLQALLQSVRHNAESLGIDPGRTAVWASSGNVPLALSVLMRDSSASVQCAVLCYGYMLDLDGATGVAEGAKRFGFANPCTAKSVDDLRPETPLFIARAGADQTPRLNESLDRFVAAALERDLPLTLVNHAAAPHAFDLLDDSQTTREIIRQILAFLRRHLALAPGQT